jgi:hypothetical protein
MSNKKMFSSVVENSLDFLNKAIVEIKDDPVFSLIHFYTGLELLLKARLMNEHWSLIVNRKSVPDLQKFRNGDFQSINLDEILDTLDKTLGIKVAKPHADAFHLVRKHRNKIIHFFHDAQAQETKTEQIVKEQLVAWHFLQQIITTQWFQVFKPWNKELLNIDKGLRQNNTYLQIIFDEKAVILQQFMKQGFKIEVCPSCKFKSLVCSQSLDFLYQAKCEVCNLSEPRINIECPHCTRIIAYEGDATTHCKHCKKQILIKDIENILIDQAALHIRAIEGDLSSPEASCVECDGFRSVINTKHNQLLCMACLSEFPEIYLCDWCGEGNTRILENSYYEGCSNCNGASDWRRDD